MQSETAEAQSPELARLAAEADILSADMAGADLPPLPPGAPGAPGAEPAAPEAAGPSNAEVITGMLLMLAGLPLVAKVCPSVPPLITEAIAKENGEAAGALMDKYGWNFGGLERWAVEIRAAVSCGSLVYAIADAASRDLAARRKPAEEPGAVSPAPTPEGQGAAVTFG